MTNPEMGESMHDEVLRRLDEICETQRVHSRKLDQLDEAMRGDGTGHKVGLFSRMKEVESQVEGVTKAKWLAAAAFLSAAMSWLIGGWRGN